MSDLNQSAHNVRPPAPWILAACVAVCFPALLAYNRPPSATFLNQDAAFVGWGAWLMLLFIGIVVWALWPSERRKADMRRNALIPFRDDDDPASDIETR